MEFSIGQTERANAEATLLYDRCQRIQVDVILKTMPGKCTQCGSGTYLGRTTVQTDVIEIQNIPCTVCQECGQEQIGQRVQKSIDKLLERAGKGKLKSRVVVM